MDAVIVGSDSHPTAFSYSSSNTPAYLIQTFPNHTTQAKEEYAGNTSLSLSLHIYMCHIYISLAKQINHCTFEIQTGPFVASMYQLQGPYLSLLQTSDILKGTHTENKSQTLSAYLKYNPGEGKDNKREY